MITDTYCVAVCSRFSGTFRNLRIGCKNTSPPIVSTTAANRPSTRELPKDLRNLSISFAPKHCAEIIAKPLHIPIRNCTIRLLSVVVAPTAARALSPRKVPTMRVSARLYVSCNKLAKKIGRANVSIKTDGLPLVRSFI